MLKFTTATKQDIPQIIQCKTISQSNSFCDFYGVDRLFFETNIKKWYSEMESFFDKGTYFVAKDGEKIIGVACACSDNWIRTVWVLPKYQGQGIGKKLVQSCINLLQPRGDIYLSTGRQDNDKSLNFYKKLGFVQTGKIKELWISQTQKRAIEDIELILSKKIKYT